MSGRVVLLNALPMSMLPWERHRSPYAATVFSITLREVEAHEIRGVVREAAREGRLLCYIRHPATVRALSKALGVDLKPSSGLYEWEMGDIVFIVTLKRPVRGREAEEVKLEDLRIIDAEIMVMDEVDPLL